MEEDRSKTMVEFWEWMVQSPRIYRDWLLVADQHPKNHLSSNYNPLFAFTWNELLKYGISTGRITRYIQVDSSLKDIHSSQKVSLTYTSKSHVMLHLSMHHTSNTISANFTLIALRHQLCYGNQKPLSRPTIIFLLPFVVSPDICFHFSIQYYQKVSAPTTFKCFPSTPFVPARHLSVQTGLSNSTAPLIGSMTSQN